MFKKFLAWISGSKGWLLIVLLIVAGAAAILIGHIFGTTVSNQGFWNDVADFAGDIGKAALGGGVSGAVIKIMATEGVFLDAVAAVTYGSEGLERRTPEQRAELWRSLTRMIYLPFLASENGATTDPSREKLASDLEKAIANSFTYNQPFFVRRLSRRLEITWANEADARVSVEEVQDIIIEPFDLRRKIEWVTETSPDSNSTISDYEISGPEPHIEPAPKEPARIEQTDERRKTTQSLEGAPDYKIRRERTLKWSLEKDPILAFISPYVVSELQIEISNRARGLTLTFKDIGLGGPNTFKAVGVDGKSIRTGQTVAFRMNSPLLPDQGFMIVFTKSSPGANEESAKHR